MTTNREQLIKEIEKAYEDAHEYTYGNEITFIKDNFLEAIANFIEQRDQQIWDAASETYGYDRENPYQTGNLKYPTLESYLTSLSSNEIKTESK